ncbi:ABC transporter G family member 26 like [Actinidia chinensis var. chinensis]|uniref:ABC transporter G family member 26 like n=1 Tax=Actinidia chinensis var. chinensis TaxID=1590841 RepID=A0A2R6PQF1_ACTCC|nr:ABC transporter G family member 26 like [Actinidia chinensis var. chinensis]
MERQDDQPRSPPTMVSMHLAGSNSFGHSIEFMSQAYLRNRSSEIGIQDETLETSKDRPLPIFLKVEDVEYKVRMGQACSNSPILERKWSDSLDLSTFVHLCLRPSMDSFPGSSLKPTVFPIRVGLLSGVFVVSDLEFQILLFKICAAPKLLMEEAMTMSRFQRFDAPAMVSMRVLSVVGAQMGVSTSKCGFDRAGRTIIMTIHQPSSRMFHMFNKVLLISEGYPVYYGKARESMDYFLSLRFVPDIAMNPAEFLIDLATGQVNDIRVPEELHASRATADHEKVVIEVSKLLNFEVPSHFLFGMYLQLKYKTLLEPKEKQENHQRAEASDQLRLGVQIKKDWTISWGEQFMILSKRTFRERWRDYFDKLRPVQALGVSVLLGLLWWKSQTGTEAQLRDQIGLMFYICIFWTSSSLFGAVYVFPFEKLYLVKERKADMYRLSVYYMCSTLCDMVAHVFYPSFFMGILYFMAGFKRTVSCFFMTLSAILLIAITSQCAGELFGAAVLSTKRAGMIASLVLMLFLLTGGYYVQHIPKFMQWLKYISFMYYGFRLLLKVQYSGDQLYECESKGGCRPLQSSPSFDTVNLKGGLQEVWHIPKFMQWLKYISFMYYGFRLLLKVQYSGDQLYECESKGGCRPLQSSPSFDTVNLKGGLQEVWVLLAMALGYRLCAYICLRRRINTCHL